MPSSRRNLRAVVGRRLDRTRDQHQAACGFVQPMHQTHVAKSICSKTSHHSLGAGSERRFGEQSRRFSQDDLVFADVEHLHVVNFPTHSRIVP